MVSQAIKFTENFLLSFSDDALLLLRNYNYHIDDDERVFTFGDFFSLLFLHLVVLDLASPWANWMAMVVRIWSICLVRISIWKLSSNQFLSMLKNFTEFQSQFCKFKKMMTKKGITPPSSSRSIIDINDQNQFQDTPNKRSDEHHNE